MIVNIRGANGAGKTHLVRQLISMAFIETVIETGKGGIAGHLLSHGPIRTFVVGDYTSPGSGGCDKIKTVAEVITIVQDADILFHNVVFEGILISTTFGAVGEWALNYRNRFTVLHLETSVDECLENIIERRKRAAVLRSKPVPRQNIIDKDRAIRGACNKFREAGFSVVTCPGRGALPTFLALLGFTPEMGHA